MAANHLHFHPPKSEPVVGVVCTLVSLVDRRRRGAGVGSVPTHSLLCGRNDRDDGRGVFLRQQFFQLDADSIFILCFCTLLSRRSDLHSFYFTGQDQMASLGGRCVLADWILLKF